MNRIIIISAMMIVAFCCAAVEPPASMKYLNGYFREDSKASETVVTGKTLRPYDLDIYRGLTLTGSPEAAALIEEAVRTDAQRATDREISYRDGCLYYAFLTLKPSNGKNRYVFYLNQYPVGGDKIILIYMSGKADAVKIKKMIKK